MAYECTKFKFKQDYAKLDKEIKAVVNIMNVYSPDLYMDIHVTDGADYQYDIIGGGTTRYFRIAKWLDTTYKLKQPRFKLKMVIFQVSFYLQMIVIYRRKYFNSGGPRFSDSYGICVTWPLF
jgi:hypothetical protein